MDAEILISIFFRTVSSAFAHSGGSRSGSSPDSLFLRENPFPAHTVAEKNAVSENFSQHGKYRRWESNPHVIADNGF